MIMATILSLDLDIIQLVIAILAMVFIPVIVFFLGMMTNIRLRLKVMQFLNHKEYYMINLLSPDRKKIKPFIMAIPKGVIRREGKRWVTSGSRIYREGKTEEGIDVKSEDIKAKVIFEENGFPSLFISESDFKALGIEGSEDLRPDEIDAILSADVQNEMERRKGAEGKGAGMNWGLIVSILIMGLVLGNMILTFLTKTDVGTIMGDVGKLVAVLPKP